MARYYGLDLRDCCYGAHPLGARRLLVLVRHLPAEAASRDPIEWTVERELAASGIETTFEIVRVLHGVMRMWADDKSRKRIVIPAPLRVPRPHERSAPEAKPAKAEWPPRLRITGRELAQRLVAKRGE